MGTCALGERARLCARVCVQIRKREAETDGQSCPRRSQREFCHPLEETEAWIWAERDVYQHRASSSCLQTNARPRWEGKGEGCQEGLPAGSVLPFGWNLPALEGVWAVRGSAKQATQCAVSCTPWSRGKREGSVPQLVIILTLRTWEQHRF